MLLNSKRLWKHLNILGRVRMIVEKWVHSSQISPSGRQAWSWGIGSRTGADQIVCYQVYYQCSQVNGLLYGQYQPTQNHFPKSTSMSVTVNAYIPFSLFTHCRLHLCILNYHLPTVSHRDFALHPNRYLYHPYNRNVADCKLTTFTLLPYFSWCIQDVCVLTRHRHLEIRVIRCINKKTESNMSKKECGISIRIEWNTIYNVTVHSSAPSS